MATLATQPNQAIAQRKDVRALIQSEAFLDQVKSAVPAHMNATVLLRVATTTIQKTPLLLECTRESLLGAVIECAQLGLVPDGILGQAYLVPYKSGQNGPRRAQLQIGYRGLIELARRSGQVAYVVAEPVYRCDEFSISFAPERTIHHVPNLEEESRGQMGAGAGEGGKKFIPAGFRGVYALVKYKTGEIDFEYLPLHKVEQIRTAAKAGSDANAPWMNHWVEMARKSAIRALGKRLPLSAEFMKASNLDDLNEQGIDTGDARAHLSDTVLADVAQDKAAELAEKYAPQPSTSPADETPIMDAEYEYVADGDPPMDSFSEAEANPSGASATSANQPRAEAESLPFSPFGNQPGTTSGRSNRNAR